MTWQGVAWAIGGGALVPPETARLLAYLAIGGMEGEGVVGPGDCLVRPQATPDGTVRIMPGAVGVLNRFEDALTGGQQAYLCRQQAQETVTIAATGTSARTDLVCVVVNDPQYTGSWPADRQQGPYVSTVVYENVGTSVSTLADVDPGQAGYALARVTVPASTSVIDSTMIADLRKIPNPRTRQVTKLKNCGNGFDQNLTSSSMVVFPDQASWNVSIPSWAVKVHLELYAAGVQIRNTKAKDPNSDADDTGNFKARARLRLGSVQTDDTEVSPTVPQAQREDTFTYLCAGEVAIPKALRGTTQPLEAMALRSDFSTGIEVHGTWGTTVVCKATFFEDAATDAWDV